MTLIFASSLYEYDPQVDLLRKVLEDGDEDFVILNPLNHSDISKLELRSIDGHISVAYWGQLIYPECFYVMRKWRTDCVAVLPEGCDKPTLYRNKLHDFLLEVAYAYRETKWFPGKIDQIELADSKIALLTLAKKVGLTVPYNTTNSFGRPKEATYRKSLSYPFSITFDTSDGEEVAVTLFNSNLPQDENGGIPWQWQSKIEPYRHVRSIFVRQSHWSFFAEEKDFGGKSLRERQEGGEVTWRKFDLRQDLVSKIVKLMEHLRIDFACPEFIVDAIGNHYFIDLNPCGDWYGFGSEDDNINIASAIVANL